MKYYFPTTTLNFDSIISSQLITPAGMYRADTLWWNRFEPIVGQRQDSIVLYNKIPMWTIDDPDRDNYPLIVEIDRTFTKNQRREYVIEKGVKAILLTTPISFSAADFIQGKVRFLFRNTDEMNRMLVKASTSVAEYKVESSIRFDIPDVFAVLPKEKSVQLQHLIEKLSIILNESPDVETVEYPCELVKEERERGAELGYQVGRYVKSLRSGSFLDAFRMPISYKEWRDKILPEPFEAILNHLCERSIQPWDPNRIAIVAFCRERWGDCFKGKKIKGNEIREGTSLHASLQAIARHWASPEEVYRISGEENPYMQAFAAFLECGTCASKYPRFAKEPLLKKPEYLLSLYGALVGYTSFSRILLDNKMYLPPQLPSRIPKQSEEYLQHCDKDVETPRPQKKPSDVHHIESVTISTKMADRCVSHPPKSNLVQPVLNFDSSALPELVHDKSLLVCDATLCEDIAKQYATMEPERLQKLTRIIKEFSNSYTSGYYGEICKKRLQKPTNPDIIEHLIRCFSSKKTEEYNFPWSEDDKNKFIEFLENRYACRRKSYNANNAN